MLLATPTDLHTDDEFCDDPKMFLPFENVELLD